MGLWIFLSFGVVSVFSFVSVVVWAGTRQEERQAFYRSEMLKKLAESGSAAVIEYLREEERLEEARRARQRERRLEGTRPVGLILIAFGAIVVVALRQLVPFEPVYLFGLVPIGIGVVFLLMPFISRHRT
jgi:hypothetical protein